MGFLARIRAASVLGLALFLGASAIQTAGAAAPATRRKTLAGPDQTKVEVSIHRELVYELCLDDGTQYQRTFCPEKIDAIYLLAGRDNAVAVKRAGVYFWPLTGEYMGDWTAWNDNLPGCLEISGGNGISRRLYWTDYTLSYPEGYAGKAARLLAGNEARKEATRQQESEEAYNRALAHFQQAWEGYSTLMARYLGDPKAFGLKPPPEPQPPVQPKAYTPPLEEGFIVNLPPGEYQACLRDGQGRPVPGSKKKLVVFRALTSGVAYQIIPEEKWTYPSTSDSLEDQILGRQNQVIYLKPYRALQFNKHHYLRLTRLRDPLAGRGMKNQGIWVHISPWKTDGELIEVTGGGRSKIGIEEKPYYVKQNPGYVLGYRVLEYTAERFPGQEPTFSAYRVAMPADFGRHMLRLRNGGGIVIASSTRELRTIRRARPASLFAPAFLPLAAGLVVLVLRVLGTRRDAEDGRIDPQ